MSKSLRASALPLSALYCRSTQSTSRCSININNVQSVCSHFVCHLQITSIQLRSQSFFFRNSISTRRTVSGSTANCFSLSPTPSTLSKMKTANLNYFVIDYAVVFLFHLALERISELTRFESPANGMKIEFSERNKIDQFQFIFKSMYVRLVEQTKRGFIGN